MARCRSCQQLVVWARTRSGRPIPLDARYIDGIIRPLLANDGNLIEVDIPTVYGASPVVEKTIRDGTPRMRSHLATCPEAHQWRRPVA